MIDVFKNGSVEQKKPARWLTVLQQFCAVAFVLLLLGQPAWAQPLPDLNGINKEAGTGPSSFFPQPVISLQQATAIARKHTGGKVLSANPGQRGAVTEYRVRMLVNGERVVTVIVDHNGQVRERR